MDTTTKICQNCGEEADELFNLDGYIFCAECHEQYIEDMYGDNEE